MRFLLLAATAFVVMEPVTAATHRWVMHGVGERVHRSHHRRGGGPRWEANDAFPVVFAAIVCLGMFVGFNVPGWDGLVAGAVGVTLYGAAYALVHDVYIHGRLSLFAERRVEVLERLAEAHELHHRYGRAPYGMLLPLIPRGLRERANGSGHESSRRRERIAARPGS